MDARAHAGAGALLPRRHRRCRSCCSARSIGAVYRAGHRAPASTTTSATWTEYGVSSGLLAVVALSVVASGPVDVDPAPAAPGGGAVATPSACRPSSSSRRCSSCRSGCSASSAWRTWPAGARASTRTPARRGPDDRIGDDTEPGSGRRRGPGLGAGWRRLKAVASEAPAADARRRRSGAGQPARRRALRDRRRDHRTRGSLPWLSRRPGTRSAAALAPAPAVRRSAWSSRCWRRRRSCGPRRA